MASGLTVQRSNPRRDFFTQVQNGSGVHRAFYTMVTRSFPRVKRPGRGVYHPTTSSADFKGRVALHTYTKLYTSMTGNRVDFTLPYHH
jgi:hypothetical protein